MRTRSKSGLFLIELIIAILFFSLGSIVCVRMFLTSHLLALDSERMNSAVAAARSAAEIYQSGGNDLLVEMTGATLQDNEFTATFDESGSFNKDGEFIAVFSEDIDNNLGILTIKTFYLDQEEEIFDMRAAKYSPQ